MKILFIVPLDHMTFNNVIYIMPLGLLSLATILKENNEDVEIIDFNYLFLNKMVEYSNDQVKNMETMVEYILGKSPDIIGFTGVCSTFHNVLFLSSLIKDKDNHIKIMLGGPQTSSLSKEILQMFPWIDLICVGEGENKISAIIKGLERNDLTDVAGITYRNNGMILQNTDMPLIEDLDALPLLNYTLSPGGYTGGNVSMEITRGCPYNCIFCSTSQFWKRRFRTKSIERICKEIAIIKEISHKDKLFVSFIDDNFTTDYNFTMKLCHSLQKLDIKWDCSARIDTVDDELIKQMALAGCAGIFLGIESGSPRIQKYIKKNLNLEQVNPLIDTMIKYNIKPIVSFMYGFPEETEEDLNLTLNMLYSVLKKGSHRTQLQCLCILPGTQLFNQYKDKLVFKDCHSSLTDNYIFESCNSFIIENREIFPNLYVLENTLADKYPHLDRFVTFIFTHLYRFFPETLNLILNLFENNLLTFYNDFLFTADGLSDYWITEDYRKDLTGTAGLTKKAIAFLTEYINNKSFNDFSFKIISHKFCAEKSNMITVYKDSQKREDEK